MQKIIPDLKVKLSNLASRMRGQLNTQAKLREEYERVKHNVQTLTPGNPAIYGYKIYSQCDEDGIIAYIFSHIGEGKRIFVEIGCGDGLENNTHALALAGWRGAWIDADPKKIKFIKNSIKSNSRLIIIRARISELNACNIINPVLNHLGTSEIDFLSLDIDSKDLYVMQALIAMIKPRVICVEYNAKFPPPLEISVKITNKIWNGDDYQGASLCCFVKLLKEAGYTLLTCNLSGVNAFFVRTTDATKFPSFTPEQLYQPARYDLIRISSGHQPSLKFLKDAVMNNST